MDIIRSLELYGFTRNQTLVYVGLLKRLESTAFKLAEDTEIPRSTVYTILESLKKQGVVASFRKNNVAYFTPESPNQLLSLLKKKEEIVNDIMPQIRALTSRRFDEPIVKLYIGLDGIKTGLRDIIETSKTQKIKQILATSQSDLLKYLPKYFPNWLKQREDLGVFTKLILPSNAHGYLSSNKLREVKYLSKKFPFASSVTIYGNKLAFFSLENDEPYCVLLESAPITNMFTQFFLFAWVTLR